MGFSEKEIKKEFKNIHKLTKIWIGEVWDDLLNDVYYNFYIEAKKIKEENKYKDVSEAVSKARLKIENDMIYFSNHSSWKKKN